MADIKNYLKEKSKRDNKGNNTDNSRQDYKDLIRQHKLQNFYKAILVVSIIAVIALVLFVQYKNHIYTAYDTVATNEITGQGAATNITLGDSVLTYSKDGAHCTDPKGNVVWNQTFEIQDMCIDTCKDAVIMGNYNGRTAYVANSDSIITQIETTLPIKNMAVSENGHSTIIMTDSQTTWINTYDESGTQIYSGQTHMQNSGYPFAISLSPNGELLAVSYIYVDSGTVKTNIAFYNFGPVGANQSDYMVSAYTYTDLMIPYVKFINDTTCYAVADSRVMIFKGGQKPESSLEHLYDSEILSVFSNGGFLGLVFASDNSDYLYKMDVYNASPALVGTYYFNTDYTDIFFEDNSFVAYNEKECMIKTFGDVEKFNGLFDKSVRLMSPTHGAYKYLLTTENTFDTIQLK